MLPRQLSPTLFLLSLFTGPLSGQDHPHTASAEQLGRVTFTVDCAEEVRPRFERAVAMLHSFWFEEAHAAFEGVAAADSTCAMAHWGVALTLLGNPFIMQSPPAGRLKTALAAAERASALAASASPRERGYVDAVLALYRSYESVAHRARMEAHEAAMRQVHEQHPEDVEAAVFYARAVIANAPASDLEFTRQRHAASILEPLFRDQPDHPGIAHYLIHAFDAPRLASEGLEAARRYAGIAPSAPHALHMPSHIFTRLGYWDESIETNRRSANAEPNPDAAVHPMDYMVYAYLQQGRDRAAKAVIDRAVQNTDMFYAGVIGYNFAAMPARYSLERGRWNEAASLPLSTGAPPFVEAVTRFGRAIGGARGGKMEIAHREVAALARLRDTLRQSGDAYWSTIVEAQRLAASAWIAHAAGDPPLAMRLAQSAAALEETVEKHPVTPGPLLPARELEGDLLLELGRPAEALRSYEKTLEREPNRARALYGAARAAELANERDVARKRYGELLALMERADSDRPEPEAARTFLSGS